MQRPSRPLTIFVSDIHLSLARPASRADENWLDAQGAILDQITDFRNGCDTKPPVICAGDIFDRWCSPPELINWAIKKLRAWEDVYAIAGQHDLPMHNNDEVFRSAYWTLAMAGVFQDAGISTPCGSRDLSHHPIRVSGFPWNVPIKRLDKASAMERFQIAVNHRYTSIAGHEYTGAPRISRASMLKDMLEGYHVAVFGDNHIPFQTKVGDCQVLNPGCLIRRKSDERKHDSCFGVLWNDGHCELIPLDTSHEKWIEVETPVEERESPGLQTFIEELCGLDVSEYDFRQAVEEYLLKNKVTAGVKEELLQAMEPGKE